jgi:SAM-dependent methyltransferase
VRAVAADDHPARAGQITGSQRQIDYQRLYEYRFRHVHQSSRDLVWGAIAPVVYEWLGRPERILDPAAGRCEFLNAVPVPERWGVDAVKHENAVPRAGTRMLVSEIMLADLPCSYFDGIFVSNFLEHLGGPNDVYLFLRKMWECLRPGGRMVITGPNFRYCANEYFDYADHCVILTERSVAEHLYVAGFHTEKVYPRCLPYSFTGHLPSHPALVRAYLRFRPAWRLFGKQFLVIAVRPPLGGGQGAGSGRCRPDARHWHDEA